jgi:type 1 glutamine amidotransferase
MKHTAKLIPFLILMMSLFAFSSWKQIKKPKVLVFSKTAGYRHESIRAGKLAMIKMGKENGFDVDTTENENYFNEDSLKKYSAVIFLSTTGNVLNSPQQISFERYIQSGGAYVGIHAAADTEYDWPWYGKLAGAYFMSHPKIQDATLNIRNRNHISTKHLPENWNRKDEWYNYKNINKDVQVLINLDEKSYGVGYNMPLGLATILIFQKQKHLEYPKKTDL